MTTDPQNPADPPDAPWLGDDEYEFKTLQDVSVSDDGKWLKLSGEDGWTLLAPHPGWVPKAGDVARFYGPGIGHPCRGVVIEGRAVFYLTPAQEATRQQEQSAKFEAETKAAEEAARAAGFDGREMRKADVPWFDTMEDLAGYLQKLTNGPHCYDTAALALSLASVAAFQFMCRQMGATGFQAGFATMEFVRRTLHMDGPFMLIDAEKLLWPQYNLHADLNEAIERWRDWAAEEARKKLAEDDARTGGRRVHREVRKHWQYLSRQGAPKSPIIMPSGNGSVS